MPKVFAYPQYFTIGVECIDIHKHFGELLSASMQLSIFEWAVATCVEKRAIIGAVVSQWVRFRSEEVLSPEELSRKITNDLSIRPAHIAIVHRRSQVSLNALCDDNQRAVLILQDEYDGDKTLFHLHSTWGSRTYVGSLLLAAVCRSVEPAAVDVWPALPAASYFRACGFVGPSTDFEELHNCMRAPHQSDQRLEELRNHVVHTIVGGGRV